MALVTEDAYQGKGIGTKLMERLTNVARENGITIFEADVLFENKEMMRVIINYSFHIKSELQRGVYHVKFSIAPTIR
ncbi:GNAT family N-acetyltransferase [Thermodesulfobacteriota bacterium]